MLCGRDGDEKGRVCMCVFSHMVRSITAHASLPNQLAVFPPPLSL